MPTDYREPVESFLRELTPDIDAAALYLLVERYESLIQRLSECISAVDGGIRSVSEAIDGQTSAAADAVGVSLVRALHTSTEKVDGTAEVVRAYADAVEQTRQRLTVVAAIADRELLAGTVLAAATGDTTTLAGAEHLAARTLSATAAELDRRAAQISQETVEETGTEHGQQSGGTPMNPGAMMAPTGAALAGIAAGRSAAGVGDTHPPDADLVMLRARAAVLTATQPPEVAPWIRVAVGLGIDQNGRRTVVVGTSEPAGYLRPGVVPEPHEVVVGDGRAPELAILGYFRDAELVPLAVCAMTPPPPEVAAVVDESGAHAVDPGGHEDSPDSAP
ncbi:hypothetical protein [Williamsia sp. 1135]|uniref:hypothetical protein n=1 Tax=Williamsia sp. 1135 TaxID=1889262 RepID=UPI000A10FCE9|nr:hypothetical protein [Williamsia sp. 1135]ORM37409.1 hypothetical protein BFL43_04435 [Williamsia sp. 1135]